MIEAYCVVASFDANDLTLRVNEHIKQGYEPKGPLEIGANGKIFQVMVRRNKARK